MMATRQEVQARPLSDENSKSHPGFVALRPGQDKKPGGSGSEKNMLLLLARAL